MTYEEFEQEQDIKRNKAMMEAQKIANAAYNDGLWNAVKYNPFKWHVYLLFKRPVN